MAAQVAATPPTTKPRPVQRRRVSSRYPPNPATSSPMSSLTSSSATAARIPPSGACEARGAGGAGGVWGGGFPPSRGGVWGGRPPGQAPVEALYHHRGEHGDEGDLVEVEDDRLHDRKRQGVGHADEIRGPRSELAPGVGPQRRDGQGEQHALGDQQGGRAVVDPVQRGEQRQRRRPVVGQQHEVRALPVGDAAGDRDRRPQVRVAADPLIEDDQVERAGQEAAEEVQRVQAVDEGGRDGERADLDAGAAPQRPQPTGADGRPVGRAGGGRRPGTSGLATHR